MKKTKRAIAAIASAALIFALAGCQNTSTPSVPTIDVTSEPTSSAPSPDNASSASTPESSAALPDSTPATDSTVSNDTSNNNSDTSTPEIAGGGEMSGTVFVCNDGRGFPMFGGGTGETYAKAVNEVKEKVGSQVNVFSMISPTAGSFYMPEGYSMANEKDAIDRINAQLYGIIPVDIYTALSKHTSEEIFARTDHHWMQLGAYYAAEEFVKTAMIDVPFAPISDYERHDMENYLGTLYGYSEQNPTMAKHPETFTYYISPNDFETYYMNPADAEFTRGSMFQSMPIGYAYGTFMGGDEKVVHVKTDVTNSRKLLIVKDSYPNALVPCLTGSFEEIWTVDMRHLEKMQHFPHSISQIVEEQGITDVLFCMNTFSAFGSNASHLPGIT
ncbi:MAG: hypothetical protein K2J80_03825 [Oscillospiraceae bacterium]|nr:hypothetical protein [Oscillospiraceae bacterium]